MSLTQPDSAQDAAERVAAEVRAEMARQGVSQEVLGRRLGWSQRRVSRRVTTGKTAVPFDVAELAAVATALGVPVTQFVGADVASAA